MPRGRRVRGVACGRGHGRTRTSAAAAQCSRCSTYTAAARTISLALWPLGRFGLGWCGRNSIATGRVPLCAFLLVTACNVLVLVFFFCLGVLVLQKHYILPGQNRAQRAICTTHCNVPILIRASCLKESRAFTPSKHTTSIRRMTSCLMNIEQAL